MDLAKQYQLAYTPLIFPDDGFPEYSFIDFGELDGIGIQIEQPNGWRTFLPDGLGFIFQQERALLTGNDSWIAERIIELNALRQRYQQN